MNDDILIAIVLVAIAVGLIFIGRPNKAGVHPRFLQFDTALVLFPPVVIVFVAGGFAELIAGLLRIGQ